MKKLNIFSLLIFLLIFLWCGVAGATDFYVTPSACISTPACDGTTQDKAYAGFADLDDEVDGDGWTDIDDDDKLIRPAGKVVI